MCFLLHRQFYDRCHDESVYDRPGDEININNNRPKISSTDEALIGVVNNGERYNDETRQKSTPFLAKNIGVADNPLVAV